MMNPLPNVNATPAMQQYVRMKAEHPDALLFFRMGDFYELFFEDAVVAAKALDITLTSRAKDKDGTPIPMCGVPHHAGAAYISRLVRQGHHVALCEQLEDPRTAKGVVKRDVVRVITPATQVDAEALEGGETSFVLAVWPDATGLGVAYLDATTGAFFASEWVGPDSWVTLRDDIGAQRPREILLPQNVALPGWLLDSNQPEGVIPRTLLEPARFDPRAARRKLLEHFGVLSLEAFGCEALPLAATAAGVALEYVHATQKRNLDHVTGLRTRSESGVMIIDGLTRRNLELTESLSDGGRRGTLLSVLDETRTAMGARLLREWILTPLTLLDPIQDRLDAVEELAFTTVERGRLRDCLSGVQDIERIASRVALGTASPRDLGGLARSLRAAHEAPGILGECTAPLLRLHGQEATPPLDVAETIERTLADEPPATTREPGVIRAEVDAELDSLRDISHGGRTTIAAIEERERTRTGIASLKVRYNRVFGYYIEVSKSNLSLVPRTTSASRPSPTANASSRPSSRSTRRRC